MFSRLFKSIIGNFKTKVLALVIALGIWFYANSRLTEERPVTVALELTPPAGYRLLDPGVNRINVIVSGPRSLLETVRTNAAQDVAKMLHQLTSSELSTVSPDRLERVELEVQREWMDYGLSGWEAARLQVAELKPQVIKILANPEETRTVPVYIRVPLGADLPGELEWSPKEIEVTGPAAVVRQLDSIGLQNEMTILDVGSRPTTVALQRSREVNVNGEIVRVQLALSRANADVWRTSEVEIVEQEEFFDNIPVRLLIPTGFPLRARLADDDPGTVRVRVKARPEHMNRLRRAVEATPGSLAAYVDLGNLPEQARPGDTYKELVRVRLPNTVAVAEVGVPDPDNANVNLELTIILEALETP